jgi:hypothetical protein
LVVEVVVVVLQVVMVVMVIMLETGELRLSELRLRLLVRFPGTLVLDFGLRDCGELTTPVLVAHRVVILIVMSGPNRPYAPPATAN